VFFDEEQPKQETAIRNAQASNTARNLPFFNFRPVSFIVLSPQEDYIILLYKIQLKSFR